MGADGSNALSKLSAPQVREMREGFQVLDRDGDGQVGRDDVVDMLNNLGPLSLCAPPTSTSLTQAVQDSSAASTSAYFPPGAPQTVSLPQYLTQLSSLLAPLSAPDELTSAFAAFDDDDGGTVDVAELRDALLHTPGENGRALSARDVDKIMDGFTGKKAFGKKNVGGANGRGEVFKYREFVGAVSGGGAAAKEGGSEK